MVGIMSGAKLCTSCDAGKHSISVMLKTGSCPTVNPKARYS